MILNVVAVEENGGTIQLAAGNMPLVMSRPCQVEALAKSMSVRVFSWIILLGRKLVVYSFLRELIVLIDAVR